MTGHEDTIMGVLMFIALSPFAFFGTLVGIGIVRALKDGIRND